MRALLMGLILSMAACGARTHAEELKVANLRVGEVCHELAVDNVQTNRKSSICFETEEIHVNGQGRCRAVGFSGPVPCTWYGYEFDYSGASPGDVIVCTLTSSKPSVYLNPREIVSEETTSVVYELALETPEGHLYNPQYSILHSSGPKGVVLDEETKCYAGDKQLFSFRRRLIYPEQTR